MSEQSLAHTEDPFVNKTVRCAVGAELWLAREERGWSRDQLVARLPSRIGSRTLLSYEHGSRQISVMRLIEICQVLGISAGGLLITALQRARIHLENLVLRVDLHAVIDNDDVKFRPMRQWARNKLARNASGVAEVTPSTVAELADFVGCDRSDLAAYLARFIPEHRPVLDDVPLGAAGGAHQTAAVLPRQKVA